MQIKFTIEEGALLTLEPGHRVWITTSNNEAQCREIPFHGDTAASLPFVPEPDWPNDAFELHLTDPRGGHLIERGEQARWIEQNNAKAIANKIASRVRRQMPPTLSLRAFGNGRETPFRGFP